MFTRRTFKLIHVVGTAWFALGVAYVVIWALRQAGVQWWVIFSLSGYSIVAAFLLLSVYLFAIYRGAIRGQEPAIEHPLTSTSYYMVFYGASPLLGGLAGTLGMLGVTKLTHFVLGIALGTLAGTFLVWIIIDPTIALIEMWMPVSRKHRLARLALAKKQRQEQQRQRERLLNELEVQEQQERRRWQELLKGEAAKLAALITNDEIEPDQAERQVVDIGVHAWRVGGLNCMQQLHDMALDICTHEKEKPIITDQILVWWDGVGGWRSAPLAEKGGLGRV